MKTLPRGTSTLGGVFRYFPGRKYANTFHCDRCDLIYTRCVVTHPYCRQQAHAFHSIPNERCFAVKYTISKGNIPLSSLINAPGEFLLLWESFLPGGRTPSRARGICSIKKARPRGEHREIMVLARKDSGGDVLSLLRAFSVTATYLQSSKHRCSAQRENAGTQDGLHGIRGEGPCGDTEKIGDRTFQLQFNTTVLTLAKTLRPAGQVDSICTHASF